MSYRTYSAKDGNHDALVAIFRRMGCTVLETIRTGIPGMPDLICGCLGKWHAVEIKNPDTAYGRKGLNANQTAFGRDNLGEPVFVVDSEDGVIALVNQWRKPRLNAATVNEDDYRMGA